MFNCVLFGVGPTNGLTHHVPAQRSVQRMRAGCLLWLRFYALPVPFFFFFFFLYSLHVRTHKHMRTSSQSTSCALAAQSFFCCCCFSFVLHLFSTEKRNGWSSIEDLANCIVLSVMLRWYMNKRWVGCVLVSNLMSLLLIQRQEKKAIYEHNTKKGRVLSQYSPSHFFFFVLLSCIYSTQALNRFAIFARQ